MDTGAKRSQRDYTLTFKLSVVDQVEKGELSYKEAQRRYGIQGRSPPAAIGICPARKNRQPTLQASPLYGAERVEQRGFRAPKRSLQMNDQPELSLRLISAQDGTFKHRYIDTPSHSNTGCRYVFGEPIHQPPVVWRSFDS
jgi:hypothetical protein